MKDCRLRRLLNHLQNLHLLHYSFFTVSYMASFHKTQSNDQNRKKMLNKLIESHDVISLSSILYSFPVAPSVPSVFSLKGKKQFLCGQNSRKVFRRHHNNYLLSLSKDQNEFAII